jgi:HJR/Mrr/RecB family endonuclease
MQAPPSAGAQEFELLSKAYLDYKGGVISLCRSQNSDFGIAL